MIGVRGGESLDARHAPSSADKKETAGSFRPSQVAPSGVHRDSPTVDSIVDDTDVETADDETTRFRAEYFFNGYNAFCLLSL